MGRLKQITKRALLALPQDQHLNAFYRRDERRRLRSFENSEQVFTSHYTSNAWGENESASGPGSTLEYTAGIRRDLPPLLNALGVKAVFDAPCGDFNWFKEIKRPDLHYIGGDIVEPMIARNNTRYADRTTSFRRFDITHDELPDADIWLCRDCLFHLSESDIFRALENFFRSKIAFILTSTHPDCQSNKDIITGSFRLLNLTIAPFDFPAAEAVLEDWIPGFPRRHLALWTRESLTSVTSRRRRHG